MMPVPKLLQNRNSICLRSELFFDLQLDKIISNQAIAVLCQPCGKSEIARRNELFMLLEQEKNTERLEHALAVLREHQKALELLQDTKIPLDRYHRHADVLGTYVASCETLASMHDLGSLFADVADYFSSAQKQTVLAKLKQSMQTIRSLLMQMHTGILSFSSEIQLTPDCNAVSEFDRISACARSLGFDTPNTKARNTKPNRSLSDAICRLFAQETAQIENEIGKYAGIGFDEPTAYIPEFRFFLEIRTLMHRASEIGVPHCIASVASQPQYRASVLHDVSLLAKNCTHIVPNDANFDTDEPFCFLLGANGGGKTTYLRAVGINLLLFLAGCPVFAMQAEIYPFDTVLSHFPKDERFENTGRLDEEKKRVAEMLADAGDKAAFLLLNETFSGTDESRGFALLTDTAAQIKKSKHFGLCVTHFHEVMTLDFPVLSAEIDPADENKRTFRIVRQKGSASSYAADILKKYRLDKESLTARRAGNGNQSVIFDAE